MIGRRLDVLVIGGATRDTIIVTQDALLLPNPRHDPLRSTLIAFEYGAKVKADSSFLEHGGGGVNVSVGAARLGLRVGTIIAVGDDGDALAIQRILEHERIRSIRCERKRTYQTGYSFIVVAKKEGEHVAFLSRGANEALAATPALLQRGRPRWMYVSSLGARSWKHLTAALQAVPERKRPNLAWNPGEAQLQLGHKGLRDILAQTTMLLLNRDEALELALTSGFRKGQRLPVLLKHIKAWGPSCVVITDGAKGAYVYDGKRITHGTVPKGKIVDTTGAGDAFGAGFVAGMHRLGDPHAALKLALMNSASVCSVMGAQPGLLRWDQVAKLVRR